MRRRVLWVGAIAAATFLPEWGAAQDSSRSSSRSRRSRVPAVYRDYKAIEVKDGGTIEGLILYKGQAPPAEKIAIVKDQETCHVHPAQRERVVINDKGQVHQAVVFLNIREGKAVPKREKKPTIDQKGCAFEPHVQVIQTGEPFEIVNSDPVLHNIQASQSLRTVFNHVQARKGLLQEEKFKDPGPVSLQCQAHAWMKAWVYVLPHAYHAVTGEKGEFKITDVPPGEHELHVWQEHLGEQVVKVKVEPGKTSKIEFELKAPQPAGRTAT